MTLIDDVLLLSGISMFKNINKIKEIFFQNFELKKVKNKLKNQN